MALVTYISTPVVGVPSIAQGDSTRGGDGEADGGGAGKAEGGGGEGGGGEGGGKGTNA